MTETPEIPVCPFCTRPIPPDVAQSLHYLIPRSKGGRKGASVLLHEICHKEIHATLSEGEIARNFNTIEALRAHPKLEKFAEWVSKRPPEFLSPSKGGRRKKFD